MRIIFLFLLNLYLIQGQSQISGRFVPADDFTWLIAYHVTPEGLAYAGDTQIKDGSMLLELPENSPIGMYRLVYAVPQDEFHFDILYNGKESIDFDFSLERGLSFRQSQENEMLTAYFRAIRQREEDVRAWYGETDGNRADWAQLVELLRATQTAYATKTEGMLAHRFIQANRPYIPDGYLPATEYQEQRKKWFLGHLDLNDPLLQASTFLIDKIAVYLFEGWSHGEAHTGRTTEAMRTNLREVDRRLQETASAFRFNLYHQLWKKAVDLGYFEGAETIHHDYLSPLAKTEAHTRILKEVEEFERLRIGALAPDLRWEEDGHPQSLKDLQGADTYLLVFWSSTCSHCLAELPPLHEQLQNYPNLKVIAIGLEDETSPWETKSGRLSGFKHLLALGKWDHVFAKDYAVNRTPSYFLLDSGKHIIAKPENGKAVLQALREHLR